MLACYQHDRQARQGKVDVGVDMLEDGSSLYEKFCEMIEFVTQTHTHTHTDMRTYTDTHKHINSDTQTNSVVFRMSRGP